MAAQRISFWFVWLIGRLILLFAAVLILLVIVAPRMHNEPARDAMSRLLSLFASDRTVRRTAIASALGLIVTARVFFRTPGGPRLWQKKRKTPPSHMAGA